MQEEKNRKDGCRLTWQQITLLLAFTYKQIMSTFRPKMSLNAVQVTFLTLIFFCFFPLHVFIFIKCFLPPFILGPAFS